MHILVRNKTKALQYFMNVEAQWLSLSGAAAFLDVSTETIGRRAIPWPEDDQPVPGRLRWKFLKLGEDTRMERRYYVPDLDALMVRA